MPLFTFKCKKCDKNKEKFFKTETSEVNLTCECGSEEFERVYNFVSGSIWRDAKDHFENVTKPEIDRIQEELGRGNDKTFLDITGDG